MSTWLRLLVLPVVVATGVTLAAPSAAQAQVYGYAAPGYYAPPPPPPPYAYRPPYGAYYPPPYGAYYPRPTIGLSIGIPFGFGGGYRPYYHHYGHYGRR